MITYIGPIGPLQRVHYYVCQTEGELAQMVERSLSMREVPGSIPGFSRLLFFLNYHIFIFTMTNDKCFIAIFNEDPTGMLLLICNIIMLFILNTGILTIKISPGESGYQSRYFSHAKRALYHLS